VTLNRHSTSVARAILKLCLTCHIGQSTLAGLLTLRHSSKLLVSVHSKSGLVKIVVY
jgi:hypothetical protein